MKELRQPSRRTPQRSRLRLWELKQDPTMMIFNQFAEMGNPLWHYNVTGYALADLFEAVKKPGQNFAGACFTSGSAGTMSAGDLLKERYPHLKLAVGEALQCPTILDNGFGGHRIEGIGDKHIPWIHNVKNTGGHSRPRGHARRDNIHHRPARRKGLR